MYQKHEFVIKKNEEVMKKYSDAMAAAREIAENDDSMNEEQRRDYFFTGFIAEGTKGYEYMKSHITEDERKICIETGKSNEFYKEHIEYYLDMLKIISTYECEYSPIVEFKVKEDETDEECRICIEEFWDNDFQWNYCQGRRDFRPLPGRNGRVEVIDEEPFCNTLPKALNVLLKNIDFYMYLPQRYTEMHGDFGDNLKYNRISRYFDMNGNGEEAIGVFDHNENMCKIYGYGLADYGWSGEAMEDNVVDRAFLEQLSDKKWYRNSPQIGWFPHVLIDYDDEENLRYGEAWDVINEYMDHFWDEFHNAIGSDAPYFTADLGNEVSYEYSDGTVEAGLQVNEFIDYENLDEYISASHDMTSEQILNLAKTLEKLNKDFLKVQKMLAEKYDDNFDDFRNEGFYNRMLFYTDDYDILYIEADSAYENDFRTGKVKIHYKNFKQD